MKSDGSEGYAQIGVRGPKTSCAVARCEMAKRKRLANVGLGSWILGVT